MLSIGGKSADKGGVAAVGGPWGLVLVADCLARRSLQ